MRKADLQPDSDVGPNQIAVDEPVIRVTGQRHWLNAVVDSMESDFRVHDCLGRKDDCYAISRFTNAGMRQYVDVSDCSSVTWLVSGHHWTGSTGEIV